MRLCETVGEPDWVGLGRTIPEETFAGWEQQFEREPFGSNHLYDFLSNAFILLAQAFHLPGLAGKLTKEDFKYWAKPEATSSGLSDDDVLITMNRWEALKKNGTV